MNILLKNLLATIVITLIVLSIIYGGYLPFVKSSRYITALSSLSSVKTIDDFKNNFNKTLEFYSFIGDEEIPKYIGGDILNIIMQGDQPETIARALTNYIEPHLFQDNPRHLLILAQMYYVLWGRYGNKSADLEKAESYLKKTLGVGPKLPPALYGLLDIYKNSGNKERAKEIGGIILKYWPDDQKTRDLLTAL